MKRLLVFALFLPAITLTDDAVSEDLDLTVKPSLCITDNRNPSCILSFLVVWRSPESGYYCLFNDFEESSLRCWQDNREGELTDQRTVDENFSFWMTNDDLTSRIAVADVEVLRVDFDDRRRKRRKRHVWDIN